MISIIIPVYNEASVIEDTLEYLKKHIRDSELILVDGGSEDDTRKIIATIPGITFLRSEQSGRAVQMNVGASKAKGGLLFFLHADTLPPPDFEEQIKNTLASEKVVAGSFYTRFTPKGWNYELLSLLTSVKWRMLTFGDQGLFVKKEVFEQAGGFPAIPIMEDVEIQKRLKRYGRFKKLSVPVLTSGRRFEKNGFWRQLAIDIIIWLGYVFGISPQRLAKWYSYSIEKSR